MTYLGGSDPKPDDIDHKAKTYDVNTNEIAGIRLWWKRGHRLVENPMNIPRISTLDVHSIVTVIGSLAVTAFVFLHPDALTLEDIALAYLTINGGQSIGALGKGGQRWMQGGSTAPDTIIPPVTPEVSSAPFVPPPPGEK